MTASGVGTTFLIWCGGMMSPRTKTGKALIDAVRSVSETVRSLRYRPCDGRLGNLRASRQHPQLDPSHVLLSHFDRKGTMDSAATLQAALLH